MFGIEIRRIAGTKNGWAVLGYGRTYGPFTPQLPYIVDQRWLKAWY